jgi:hypothetical protein
VNLRSQLSTYTDAMPRRSPRHVALLCACMVMVVGAAMPVEALANQDPLSGPDTHAAGPQAVDARLEGSNFRLVVPFRSQKDGGRWQTSNCGPATLGMILDGFGILDHSTDDLRVMAHTYQGTLGMRTGTGLDHVAHVAEDLGIGTHGLFGADGAFRSWTVADVVSELRQGRPVMPLVRLYLVPGYAGMAPRWGHYILLTGMGPDGFYFSDSLKTDPAAGTSGVISERQLMSAMASSHIPGQAVAFSGVRPIVIWTP